MLKCNEVTELVSKHLDMSLNWHQRIAVRLHLLICKTCRLYNKQLEFIHKALTQLDNHCQDVTLPQEAKNRISVKLKQVKKI